MFSAFEKAEWMLLEPIMTVEVTTPSEFQVSLFASNSLANLLEQSFL